MKQLLKYSDPINYLLLLAFGFVFLLFFSEVTSPLTVAYSADSSIFMMMGKMFLNGKIPYVDFFDHKGPSLVLMESLGQIIVPYRSGVFLMQLLNLFLTLLVVYNSARLLVSRKYALVVCIAMLVFISRFFNMGNTTEELSLLPLFIVFYYTCKLILRKEKVTAKTAFIIGLCFSFLFWLRINNAGVIVATCIFFFFLYLVEQDYKSLTTLVLYFVLGQLPFAALYCGYFALHGGLYEMIYATFLFNFMYVESLFNFHSHHIWVNYLMLVILITGNILYYMKEKDYKIGLYSVVLFIISLLSMNVGPAYNHYFILASPAVILGVILVLYYCSNKIIQVLVLVATLLIFSRVLYQGYAHLMSVDGQARIDYTDSYSNMKYLLDQVPNEEKDRVYLYEVVSSVYPLLNMDTNYKYFVFQEWHSEIDPNILQDILNTMADDKNKPLWIVLQRFGELDENLSRYRNTSFVDVVKRDYHLYEHRGAYILYKLND